MAATLLLSGVQLLILGILGEYMGRLFLTANRKPQAVVREVIRSETVTHPETGARPGIRIVEGG
jgi:undecaprenyl-phosphate 4-deoxy-4-formamido-L-arabinose transferase